MATAAQEELVKITINDVEIEVPKGELIVESVKRLGLEIPIFCYHPRMKPVGMCRMCLVEVGFKQEDGSVRKMGKPQAGCTLPASENMVIYTDTQMVHDDRRGVLEFLLINHPLDCPICDRGGECPLQNNTMAYGPSTSRFVELKRHLPKAYPLSNYVTLDLERCIQCGRCVRFTEEISGDSQLAFRFRGAEMQPSTFKLTTFESKFSGNVIEICPVGALTSTTYRFRARPWDLETKPAICTVTPCGTNIWLDYRAGKLVRINGRINEEVNEEWTADRCKFGHDFYNSPHRIKAPHQRSGDGFEPVTWPEAYAGLLEQIEGKGDEVACLVKADVSNEGLYKLGQFIKKDIGSRHMDHRAGSSLLQAEESLEDRFGFDSVQLTIQELEYLDSLLIFATSLADDQPMSFLRARKGWLNKGMKVIVASDKSTDADAFAHAVLRYESGQEEAVAIALKEAIKTGKSKSLVDLGLDSEAVDRAVSALQEGKRGLITTYSALDTPSGRKALDVLAAMSAESAIGFSCFGKECNSRGAKVLGLEPQKQGDRCSIGILNGAAEGKIKSLILVGYDPLVECPDKELAQKALENVDYLVYIGALQTQAAAYASLILPMSLPAEQDGTYTSCEGRVQRMVQILETVGESKPLWRIATELSLRIHPGVPAFNPREIMEEMNSIPEFAGITYDKLAGVGVMLHKQDYSKPNFGGAS